MIDIIFENENFLAINKPSGLSVHSDGRTKEKTLVDFILKERPEIENVGEDYCVALPSREEVLVSRPGIVHRLDKETSGVILVAKNQEFYDFLKNLFQERKIHKTYNAFVYGKIKETRGVVDVPLGRSSNDSRKRGTPKTVRGELKPALTRFRTVCSNEKFSFLEVWPETGRTHQIRVHLKHIHHPIVSDSLYAPQKPKILGFKRLALHARKIVFEDASSKKFEILAPYPDDFIKALKEQNIEEL